MITESSEVGIVLKSREVLATPKVVVLTAIMSCQSTSRVAPLLAHGLLTAPASTTFRDLARTSMLTTNAHTRFLVGRLDLPEQTIAALNAEATTHGDMMWSDCFEAQNKEAFVDQDERWSVIWAVATCKIFDWYRYALRQSCALFIGWSEDDAYVQMPALIHDLRGLVGHRMLTLGSFFWLAYDDRHIWKPPSWRRKADRPHLHEDECVAGFMSHWKPSPPTADNPLGRNAINESMMWSSPLFCPHAHTALSDLFDNRRMPAFFPFAIAGSIMSRDLIECLVLQCPYASKHVAQRNATVKDFYDAVRTNASSRPYLTGLGNDATMGYLSQICVDSDGGEQGSSSSHDGEQGSSSSSHGRCNGPLTQAELTTIKFYNKPQSPPTTRNVVVHGIKHLDGSKGRKQWDVAFKAMGKQTVTTFPPVVWALRQREGGVRGSRVGRSGSAPAISMHASERAARGNEYVRSLLVGKTYWKRKPELSYWPEWLCHTNVSCEVGMARGHDGPW